MSILIVYKELYIKQKINHKIILHTQMPVSRYHNDQSKPSVESFSITFLKKPKSRSGANG